MSEIDVTKCRFYLDDGSCCSHDTDCTKCIHCYCDYKVHQEQLHRYKQVIEDIKEIADDRSIYCENCSGGVEDFTCNDCGYVKIIQKCEEVNNERQT